MRRFIYGVVSNLELPRGAEQRVYSSGATGMGQEDQPDRPFVMVTSQTNQPGLRRAMINQQRFQVWFHDDPGSMTDIDDGLKLIQDALTAYAESWWNDEIFLMGVEWENTSGDMFDDHFKTNTRYCEFLITARV